MKLSICIFILFVQSLTKPSCAVARISIQGTPCPELLLCDFPKKQIEFLDNYSNCTRRICTCIGTKNGLSTSGGPPQWYQQAKTRYTNCTLVDGNLELVGIDKDIFFTKHIEQVTGYVLISMVKGGYIDLSSLRLIRGYTLFNPSPKYCTTPIANTNVTSPSETGTLYALYVVDNNRPTTSGTDGLKELWMPNLTEISGGHVQFKCNYCLRFIDTILWSEIFQLDSQIVEIENNYTATCSGNSPNCSSNCSGRCWGSSSNQCQLMTKSVCTQCGNRRCVLYGPTNQYLCCRADCAGGCAHAEEKGCYACKEVSYEGKCSDTCPTYKLDIQHDKLEKKKATYQFAGYCLKSCPDNVPSFDKLCRTFCPKNYYDYNSNVCDKCENGNCNNICYGLGVNHGNLSEDTYVNAINIKNFNRNCTIIEGSLHFKKFTFDGDHHCKVPALSNEADFSVFENVQEITGYLAIEEWRFQNICIFKNLRRIHGKELLHGLYALSIFTDQSTYLRSLCFNSLKTIDNGGVKIVDPPMFLCWANEINWNNFTKKPVIANKISGTKPKDQCGNVLISKNKLLCHFKQVDWKSLFANPKHQQTKLSGRKKKKCARCSSKCNRSFGCWGASSQQCVKCRNFTDMTDSNGKVAPKWIADRNGAIYPGNNVTTCVNKCNTLKGVYSSPDKLCLPCNEECEGGCTGPGADQCVKCRNYISNSTCIAKCSSKDHYSINKTCYQCSESCMRLGCQGPLDEYSINGCDSCHYSYDESKKLEVYRGSKCEVCSQRNIRMDCPNGCIKSQSNGYSCFVVPGLNIPAIVVPIVLVVLIVLGYLAYRFRKHRSTILQMKKAIGVKMVGEHSIDCGEAIPLTPSGAMPNQAHLRIVKDNELVMGQKLGSGAFGDVRKAIWNPYTIQGEKIKIAVAVKTLKSLDELGAEANNEIMDEAYVMASVDCDYLVRLLGIRITESVSLITQLMPLGSLLEYVRDQRNHEAIHSRQMLTWFVQMAKGMLYLQEKHLVHRDLAARNVLVRTPNHVKITDFGLAKMLDTRQESYQAEGGKLPIKWLAIECITERVFSHHSDVWAYGITCWEILTFGARPYEGIRAVEILTLLERGERLPQPPTATIEVYMLLVKCWMVDRLCRPSFTELVSEFTRMAVDPTRYLVIKNDPGDCFSPNPTDEAEFFQQLMVDEKIDDSSIADEPDQYLLHRDLHNQQQQPVYANQEAVSRTQPSHPPTSGPERLFSRSTPSANLEPVTTTRLVGVDVTRDGRGPSLTEQDDVFADAPHSSSKQVHRPSIRTELSSNRKDSEEIHRYTEDPTIKKPLLRTLDADGQRTASNFTNDDYLIPTNSEAPVYLDPEGIPESQTPSALMNDTYVDDSSPPFAAPASPSRPRGPSDASYTPLSSCEEQPGAGRDYVNTNEKHSNNNTCFANEEYMATGADSGIGEDTQSLLARGARGLWEQSSSDENDQVVVKGNGVVYKPDGKPSGSAQRHPWSVSSDGLATSFTSSNALNNPGYMLLNASTSNNSNKKATGEPDDSNVPV